MNKLLHCGCGQSAPRFSKFCRHCGAPRSLVPLLAGMAAVLLLVFLGYWLLIKPPAPASTPSASAAGLPSHSLNTLEAEATMDRVDALMKKDGGTAPLNSAVKLLQELLIQYPNFGYGLRLKANLEKSLHLNDQALASYQQFLAKYPKDARTSLAYAELLLAGETPELGVQCLSELVSQFPNYGEAHDRLAKGLDLLGKPKEAEQQRQILLKLIADKNNEKPPFVYLSRIP